MIVAAKRKLWTPDDPLEIRQQRCPVHPWRRVPLDTRRFIEPLGRSKCCNTCDDPACSGSIPSQVEVVISGVGDGQCHGLLDCSDAECAAAINGTYTLNDATINPLLPTWFLNLYSPVTPIIVCSDPSYNLIVLSIRFSFLCDDPGIFYGRVGYGLQDPYGNCCGLIEFQSATQTTPFNCTFSGLSCPYDQDVTDALCAPAFSANKEICGGGTATVSSL